MPTIGPSGPSGPSDEAQPSRAGGGAHHTSGAERPVVALPHAPFALLVYLAGKTLRENRLSLALLILAVAAGVGFQMPNIANLAGYRAELLRTEIAAGFGHVRVRPKKGERFPDATPILQAVRGLPGVLAAEPVLGLPGAVRANGQVVMLSVTGVNPRAEHRPYEIVKGADLTAGDDAGVVIGTSLAKKLGVKLGDDINVQVLLATRPRLLLSDEGVGSYDLHVRGLIGGAGTERLFVSRDFLARETGEDDAATAVLIYMNVNSIPIARRIAEDVERLFPDVTARAWYDDSRLVSSSVKAIEAVEKISAAMALFAVGVPVLALLYIDALQRRRQVSLLAAMGFRAREVFAVFFCKALIVGVVGVLIGGVIGYGMLFFFQAHPIYQDDKFVIRPVMSIASVLRPMLLVLATTLIAGTYPAWRAARVDPSSMLRRIE